MFVSTYDESRLRSSIQAGDETSTTADSSRPQTPVDIFSLPPTPTGPTVSQELSDRPSITEITGVWAALADENALTTPAGAAEMKLHGRALPSNFKGFAVPELNPMVSVKNLSGV